MNRALSLIVVGVVVLVVAGFFIFQSPLSQIPTPAGSPVETPSVPEPVAVPSSPTATPGAAISSATFGTPKKSAHFEGSTPAHGSTLEAPPVNVVIGFNFDLASPSSLSVTSGGKEYGTGGATIDATKLALRRTVDRAAPDGLYAVTYRACWPDGSCHDGHFQFAIDRTRAGSVRDLRGQAAVSVRLKDIAFAPAAVRVSPGTTVTWTNDDTVEHYVNTDAHPGHTYYPAQNSSALPPGATYSVTFAAPGVYPYHCSAHADAMRATIIVG